MISFSSTNFFLKDTHLLYFFGGHFSVPAVLVVARAVTAQYIKFKESTFLVSCDCSSIALGVGFSLHEMFN